MSDYKEIKGKTIQSLGTDPSETSTEGQVWYNSTAGAFKSVLVSTAWSSGANMITARGSGGGFGTQTAAVVAGGATGTNVYSSVEEYNGSGWSSGTALPGQQLQNTSVGVLTAGLSMAGFNAPGAETLEYDGSTWTAGGSFPSARFSGSQAGVQTAALYAGGDNPSPGYLADTFEYDGTSWTAGGVLNTARRTMLGAGVQTAALASGGRLGTGDNTNASEEYNGSSWTTGNSMITGRRYIQGFGTQTNAVVGGGFPTTSATEEYDGTNWATSTATLGTARYNNVSSVNAPANAGLAAGGEGSAATEEYNKSINVITAAAWSAGGNLGTGRYTSGAFGTQTAAVLAGGKYGVPPTLLGVANTENYDGSSWSPSGNLSTARRYLSGAAGTQTSGLVFGGFDAAPGATAVTEEYDGSSWTSGGNLVNARGSIGGSGTQTAALGVGGTGRVAFSEEYNGTSWSEGNNLNTGRATAASSKNGLQTASLVFGGSSAPGPAGTSADTESYDGTSWTTVNSMNQAKNLSTGAGTQTAALSFGGYDGAVTISNSESWDGTIWSTSPSLGTANNQQAGTGLQTAALSIGGTSPLTATEEFNPETTALNLKTLTTS